MTIQTLAPHQMQPLLDENNTWNVGQRGAFIALTSTSASIAVDLDLSNNFNHTLTEDTTLAAPTNAVAGQSGVIHFTQDASAAKTLAFNAFWQFGSDVNNTFTTTLGDVGLVSYIVSPDGLSATCSASWLGSDGLGYAKLAEEQIFTEPQKIIKTNPASTDAASLIVDRDANYIGGVAGTVKGGVYVNLIVRDGVENYEWGITGVVRNYATLGEHVGIYGQGNKYISGGKTWAAAFEANDHTGSNGTGTLIGNEVMIKANGTDSSLPARRVALDVALGKFDSGGSAVSAGFGVRVGPHTGDEANATFVRAFYCYGLTTTGFEAAGSGTRGFRSSGTYTIGADFSEGSHSDSAIRIKQNEYISLDATSTIRLRYNSATGYIEFYNGATRVGYINMAGADHAL